MVGAVPSIVGLVFSYLFLHVTWLQHSPAGPELRHALNFSLLQESPAYLEENGYRHEALATLESLKRLDCS